MRPGYSTFLGILTFIVGVEDDVLVVFVRRSKSLPELLHPSHVGYDLVVVSAIVVRHDHCVGFLVSDVLDGLQSSERTSCQHRCLRDLHRQDL